MHLFKIKPLAKELSENSIGEKLSFYYLLVSIFVGTFNTYYSLWWGTNRDITFYFEFVVALVISAFGCYKAYEANGMESGSEFIKKFVCFSVPVGIRVAVIGIIIGIFINLTFKSIFLSGAFKSPDRALSIFRYTVFLVLNGYFWWMVVQGLKQIKHYESKS